MPFKDFSNYGSGGGGGGRNGSKMNYFSDKCHAKIYWCSWVFVEVVLLVRVCR